MNNYFSILCTIVSLVSVTTAFADAAKGDKHEDWPCARDVKHLCGKLTKEDVSHGAIIKCLDDNEKWLSEGCKTAREKIKASMKEFNIACQGDMDSLCKTVAAHDMRAMHECLVKNQEKLSDSCKAQQAKMKEKWEHRQNKKEEKKAE